MLINTKSIIYNPHQINFYYENTNRWLVYDNAY
jgi:hypothetical protein